jgi:sarcosine oxidase, subunit alpha
MSGKPYRLSDAGRLIDRSKRVSFTFDGKTVSGFAGDTVASAVMASGQRVMGRSFKYHRPRGVVGLGSEEMNALIGVGKAERHEPNLLATKVEIFDGLSAISQNRWPSLNHDIGAINNVLGRFFSAGFYYKTFMWPQAFWKHVYEPFIRHAAGLGKAPTGRDPDVYEQVHVHCDVLIAGAGAAGLAAAEAAAASGLRVIIADENPRLGGLADIGGGLIDGASPLEWAKARADSLAAASNVQVLTRTTVAGHFEDNYVLMFERVGDHDPSIIATGTPRHRLWKVRAGQIIIAAGAIERPIAFANNDRPGVMLASAARGFAARYGTAPGVNGVVFTNNDDAYRTALMLKSMGVGVARIIDSRTNPESALIDQAKAAGLDVSFGSSIAGVMTSKGGKQIDAIKMSPYNRGRVTNETKIDCDFVAVSGGWNPAVHLWCHNGGKIKFDHELQTYRPDRSPDGLLIAGAANGTFDVPGALAEGYAAGEQAVALLKGKAGKITKASATQEPQAKLEPIWFAPATGSYNEGDKHFIDQQNDVVASGLELAQREGYESVEHTKRYTTLGMATDQGKTSNVLGLGVVAEATGKTIPEIGTTTFRPPYTTVSFGSIAGAHVRDRFLPVRRTAIYDWHVANGADFEPVGQWRRPYCYPRAGEDRHKAVTREILAVRNKVGLLDASTLGKIEIKGPDAGEFLDRMYTNTFSTLKEGRCRYGLMANEMGFLMDDGVTVRVGPEHFIMHTTSGGADRIAGWLEEWLQTEWPDLKVFVTPVTEQWAQFAVAGPNARKVLEKLGGDIDFSAEAFPFMTMKTGTLAGMNVRAYRISFSGELSYEIGVPVNHGRALWDAILAAGVEFGLEVYGTEALHVLRAEKGFIIIGDETDNTVTAIDVGLEGLVSKKKRDFIGKRSMEQSFLKMDGRKQLVGLLTEDPNYVLPDGAHALEDATGKPPQKTLGHVTSTYMSPSIGRSIAMALIFNGRARMGETLSFSLDGKVVKAKVVEPVFYDKEGARQNV